MRSRFEKNTIFRNALLIVSELKKHGFSAFFVGGAVRDMALGRAPKDIDIATNAHPEKVNALFPGSLLVGACFGVVNVVIDKTQYEVATFRRERNYEDGRHPGDVRYADDPATDAERRDFTINGLYYDPDEDRIHDSVGGVADLKNGLIRCIGNAEERFLEDYLRMLRAIRFAAELGFSIEEKTAAAIAKLAKKVNDLSVERIHEELNRMFTGPRPASALRLLSELNVLEVILPELSATRGVTQPEKFHPEGDVFEHIVLMLEHMALPSVELAWSILLHDIGKPGTLTIDEKGVEHFYGHESRGAKVAREILERLKFPKKQIDTVVQATSTHMRYAHVKRMKKAKLRRLLANGDFALELELHRVDCISSNMKLANFCFLLDFVNEIKDEIKLPEPLVKGNDLIELGMEPGPVFKEILDDVMNAQLEGRILSRDEAMEYLHTIVGRC